MEVEAEVHFGGRLASAVFGPTDAVGDQFHDGRINGVNPDFETAQEALAPFTPGKARLDVLKMSEHRPEERFDEVSRAYFVCVRKSVARGGEDLETA